MSTLRPRSDPSAPAPARGFSLPALLRRWLVRWGVLRTDRQGNAQQPGPQKRPAPPKPARSPRAADAPALAAAVKARLDQHPDARRAFPHLRFLAQLLEHQGFGSFGELPDQTLARLLTQLDVLTASADPLLAQVQMRLLAEQHDRRQAAAQAAQAAQAAEKTLPLGTVSPNAYADTMPVDFIR
ncbi:hypothetical protein HLB44_20195 [Aquincola sp. S2]|uniref:Uncharacterized protein n=1 Tax=Pseudaquabacterium terrae TaxID=2732868 RepID=A0ABX2EL40_9BURK|nr:hypothetical protein [Aquabacterium terrae]NRF69323.1 hypothetical protein [Aquabacterium terrae]